MRRPHAIRRAVSIEYSAYYGSAVDDGDTSTSLFEDCLFERNYGATKGGVYFAFGSSKARFSRCKFMANAVSDAGNGNCAYLSTKSSPKFTACEFDGTKSPRGADSGCINARDASSLVIDGCRFVGFSANKGGAISGACDTINISRSAFIGNSAKSSGGALEIKPLKGRLENCTFHDNRADHGGALSIGSDMDGLVDFLVVNCSFVNNTATNGGAIKVVDRRPVNIVGTHFAHNHAIEGSGGGKGGAISIPAKAGAAAVAIEGCSFSSNMAVIGGAIKVDRTCNLNACQFDGQVSVKRSTFTGNGAQAANGVVGGSCSIGWPSGGAISITSASLIADADGLCFPENVVLKNLSFGFNSALLGGALHADIVSAQRTMVGCRSRSLSLSDVCSGCVSESNNAGSGPALSSSPNKLRASTTNLVFSSGLSETVQIGSVDFFGNSVNQDMAQVEKICMTVVDSQQARSLNVDERTSEQCLPTKSGLAMFEVRLAHPEHNVAVSSVQVVLKMTVLPPGGLDELRIQVELRGCPSGKADLGGKCVEPSSYTLAYITIGVIVGFLTVVCVVVVIKLTCIDKTPLTLIEFFKHLGQILMASGMAIIGLIDLLTDLFSAITTVRSDVPYLNDLHPFYYAIMTTALLASIFEFIVDFQLARVAALRAAKKNDADPDGLVLARAESGIRFHAVSATFLGSSRRIAPEAASEAPAHDLRIQELQRQMAEKEAALLVLAFEDVPMIALVCHRSLARCLCTANIIAMLCAPLSPSGCLLNSSAHCAVGFHMD